MAPVPTPAVSLGKLQTLTTPGAGQSWEAPAFQDLPAGSCAPGTSPGLCHTAAGRAEVASAIPLCCLQGITPGTPWPCPGLICTRGWGINRSQGHTANRSIGDCCCCSPREALPEHSFVCSEVQGLSRARAAPAPGQQKRELGSALPGAAAARPSEQEFRRGTPGMVSHTPG